VNSDDKRSQIARHSARTVATGTDILSAEQLRGYLPNTDNKINTDTASEKQSKVAQ